MVKVIAKAFDILDKISLNQKLPLRDIARLTSLNKTTAGNIITTLKKLGWLTQNDKGEYLLSDSFIALSYPYISKMRVETTIKQQIELVAKRVHENILCAQLRNGQRHIIAQAQSNQSITVSNHVLADTNIYDSATGRILVAYIPKDELGQLLELSGEPSHSQWPDLADADMNVVTEKIRKQAYATNEKGEIIGVAIPVFEKNGQVKLSLGAYMPKYRFNDKKLETLLLHLRAAAEAVTEQIP